MSSPFLSQDPDEIKAAIRTSHSVWACMERHSLPSRMASIVCATPNYDDPSGMSRTEIGHFSIESDIVDYYEGATTYDPHWFRVLHRGHILLLCQSSYDWPSALVGGVSAFLNVLCTCSKIQESDAPPAALAPFVSRGLLADATQARRILLGFIREVLERDKDSIPKPGQPCWVYNEDDCFTCQVGKFSLWAGPSHASERGRFSASWRIFVENEPMSWGAATPTLDDARCAALDWLADHLESSATAARLLRGRDLS